MCSRRDTGKVRGKRRQKGTRKEEGGEECRRKESELEHSPEGGIMNIGDIRDNTRVQFKT